MGKTGNYGKKQEIMGNRKLWEKQEIMRKWHLQIRNFDGQWLQNKN